MTYSEKLKDPRWQKKRLQVLEAAGWKCEYCGLGDMTLHVHHLKYTGEPWDAPAEDLEVLCEEHHECRKKESFSIKLTDVRASKIAEVFSALKESKLKGVTTNQRIESILGALR